MAQLETIKRRYRYENDGDRFYFWYDGTNFIEDGFELVDPCGSSGFEEFQPGRWINHGSDEYKYPDADNRDWLLDKAKTALAMAEILSKYSAYTEENILAHLNLTIMEKRTILQ